MVLVNRRISFLSSLQSKYDHYLPCVLNLFSYVHINQHSFKSSNFGDANTPQRALITRFTCKNLPESKPLLSPPRKQLLSSNDSKYWTRWSFATHGPGQLTQRNEHFVRTRSLDECRVAFRSRKVDFLSGNERYCVVELMRVARYFVKSTDIARFTFATKCSFFGWNPSLLD